MKDQPVLTDDAPALDRYDVAFSGNDPAVFDGGIQYGVK